RHGYLEGVGGAAVVLEDREGQLIRTALLGDRRGVVIAEAGANEGDALGTIGLRQLGQDRRIVRGDRAVERQEDDDDGFLVLEVVQRGRLAVGAGEDHVVDFLAEPGVGNFVVGADRRREQGGAEERKTVPTERTHDSFFSFTQGTGEPRGGDSGA